MFMRKTWLILLLAMFAMQAHAFAHDSHEGAAKEPSCLSCKVGTDLSAGLCPAATTLSLVPDRADAHSGPATTPASPPRHRLPPPRGPPA
ncbi:MAG: hypothetical protein ABF296_12625 [Oceanococcaceae bacterium]